MTKALFCSRCGAQLTAALSIRSGKDPMAPALDVRDRKPLTPAREAYKSYKPMVRSYSESPEPLEFVPQYWLNPGDLADTVTVSKRAERRQGCCGEAGIYGPNRLCRCGAEIGTLRDDCWTPQVFIPEPNATEWREMF